MHIVCALFVVLGGLSLIGYLRERNLRKHYQQRADDSKQVFQSIMWRTQLLEIEKFEDYLCAVSEAYKTRREKRSSESSDNTRVEQ